MLLYIVEESRTMLKITETQIDFWRNRYNKSQRENELLENNNIILAEKNKDLISLVAEEEKILFSNKYNNTETVVNKIKELVHNYHTETNSK